MQFKGVISSRGLIGTWCFIENFNLLIDAGDGLISGLFHKLGAIRYIAITHAHLDHISGLASIINLRHRMNPTSDLTLFIPSDKENNRYRAMLSLLGEATQKKVKVVVVTPGQRYQLDKHYLVPFKTKHSYDSVGYHVQEQRKRLKEEYKGLSREELIKNKGNLNELYFHTYVTFIGDSAPLGSAAKDMPKTDLLFCEATYLTRTEREEEEVKGIKSAIKKAKKYRSLEAWEEALLTTKASNYSTTVRQAIENHSTHSDLDAALNTIELIQPKNAIIMHISARYSKTNILSQVRNIRNKSTHVLMHRVELLEDICKTDK